MKIPVPGKKVRGSASGAPIMAIFDLLGRHWAMGIIWNLNHSTFTFRAIQDKCGTISPTILNTRLKELKEADIVVRTLNGYTLTARGKTLRKTLQPIGSWSLLWSKEVFGYDVKNTIKEE